MKNNRKAVVSILIVLLILVESFFATILLLYITIPSGKVIINYYSMEEHFAEINQEGYFAFINNLLPNEMALNYDKPQVNSHMHTYLEKLDPYIMYSYLPNVTEGVEEQCRIVNSKFFALSNSVPYVGRLFEMSDFLQKDIIPIVVGYNLKNKYELGKTYTFYHGDDGKTFRGEIIGILHPNTSYPSLGELMESIDNSYIIPLSDYFIDEYFGLSDYDLAVSSAITKSGEIKVTEIVTQVNETKFWELTSVPVTDVIKEYVLIDLTQHTTRCSDRSG